MWGGSGEEQTSYHTGPEGVPAGAEEELQQAEGKSAAHAGEEDPRPVQIHHQAADREQVQKLLHMPFMFKYKQLLAGHF